MKFHYKKRSEVRKKRSFRVRKKLRGSALKPRISVVKTNQHVHVQVIDDERGVTLASASTLSSKEKKGVNAAKELGALVATKMKEQDIQRAVLDRGRFKYHGIIAAVATGAREGGLQF